MRLELRCVGKRFGDNHALRDITLSIPDFQSLAVIGPSGGGKTTLLRILAGLTPPDAGEIVIDGRALEFSEAALLAHRRAVGTVFQAYNLFPHLSARENVLLPLVRAHGVPPREAGAIADALFERFHLARHAGQRPAELSGGQQQRVAIVRAIAIRPRFFVLDEPTSALDPEMTAEVLDLIAELRREGRDLVIATHNMGFAREVSDRCLFIADGQALEEGPSRETLAQPRHPLLAAFLARALRYSICECLDHEEHGGRGERQEP
ncbi:MAG: amino acid ABC transporter ATP-binding protein [Candidatus Accumulibacter sp.]|nr:amino acid ABC transporter ATP-binding protein [Accumulibacter sp.]